MRGWETERPPPASTARRLAEVLGLTGARYTRFLALAAGRDPDEAPVAVVSNSLGEAALAAGDLPGAPGTSAWR